MQKEMAAREDKAAKCGRAVIPMLRGLFVENASSTQDDEPVMSFQHGAREWSLNRQEREEFDKCISALTACFPRVHRKTCAKYLEQFCCENFPDNHEGFEQRFNELQSVIQRENESDAVCLVEVSGLRLHKVRFSIGKTEFILSSSGWVRAARQSIRDIHGEAPDEIPSGIVIAKGPHKGDSNFARESAIEATQLALDALTFLSVPLNSGCVVNHEMGFSLYCGAPRPFTEQRTWVYYENQLWNDHTEAAKMPHNKFENRGLRLNADNIEKLRKYGLDSVSKLLSEELMSGFDQNLIACMRWIAKAVRDVDPASKFLYLFISLEALFCKDGGESKSGKSQAFSTREGVAFLLGDTPEQRANYYDRMDGLATLRNRIVHEGFGRIDTQDLVDLLNYVWWCCRKGQDLRDSFRQPNSFSNWAKQVRFGRSTCPTTEATQWAKSEASQFP
jgi:hypothetical protein